MFKHIANAFKVADIRKRLLFTMLMVRHGDNRPDAPASALEAFDAGD